LVVAMSEVISCTVSCSLWQAPPSNKIRIYGVFLSFEAGVAGRVVRRAACSAALAPPPAVYSHR
jgi:hypothetical protein